MADKYLNQFKAVCLCMPNRCNSKIWKPVLTIEQSSFPTPWSRNMFIEEMENQNSRLVAFKIEGSIVGYVCFWAVLDEAHLLNIAVHPSRRHQGLGRLIMAEIESLCIKEGLKRIILEVARKNMVARDLYRKCGFHSVGFRRELLHCYQR